MAGTKSPKSRDDKTKKRKRDVNDADLKSKRHRKDQQEDEGKAKPKDSKKTPLNVHNGSKGDENELMRQETSLLGETGWKVSKPMGGRMLDIDPILTEDEQ